MKSILKLTVAASVAMLLATGCSKSDGSSTSEVTPLPDTILNGPLLDGYIKGALVFADCNHDNSFQSDAEPSTTTDVNGDYILSVPVTCPNAILISFGGIDLTTNLPFTGSLMAPPNSTTISPLTTLVTVDPSFAASIEALGASPFVDFGSTPVPSEVLSLAMSVAQTINILSYTTGTSDTASLINDIVTPLASSLVDSNLSDANATAHTLGDTAVIVITNIADSRDDITFDPADAATIKSDIVKTVITIDSAIPNGNVTVGDANNTAITAQVESAAESIIAVVPKISFSVQDVIIGDITATENNNQYNITVNEANATSTLEVVVDLNNSVADKTYTGVTLSAVVSDTASARTATVVINNIEIVAALNPSVPVLTPEQTLTITITGKDSTGANFSPVSLTGNLDNILSVTAGTFVLDIAALQAKLETETAGSGHALEVFGLQGTYTTTITTPGLPLEGNSIIANITVTP